VVVTSGKNFLYSGEVFQGKLYITTNEDASRYRVFVVGAANAKRENWKEIIPESDAVLQNLSIFGGMLLRNMRNATSELQRLISQENRWARFGCGSRTAAGIGGRWDRRKCFSASSRLPFRLRCTSRSSSGQPSLWDRVHAPIDPSAYDVQQVWFSSKDGTKVPMFVFHKKGLELNGKNPTLLTGYGGSISADPQFFGRALSLAGAWGRVRGGQFARRS